VLSVLQSCGGVSPAESLSHAAARVAQELKTARTTVSELARQVEVERSSSSSRNRAADSQGSEYRAALAAAEQKHAAEVAVMKSQLRKSELQCEQLSFDIQSTTKANSELKDQVDAFESVLAEKEAELSDISQQLRLARALVSSLSEQAEASMNLELVGVFYLVFCVFCSFFVLKYEFCWNQN
jgi:chromosome segregation ATPase